ncbi:MAG TPA: tRNA-specific adenosine deaminase, partial [Clostridiales bacterium]|nr:tRNA-specific adenosine deaminase [Clostridiales bacterium]
GASDYKTRACGSVLNIVQMEKLNHQVDVQSGVLENECSDILKMFFEELRNSKK